MKNIDLYKTYYVDNCDLMLGDTAPGHEVIIVKISKNKKRVKVKTITSLESPSNHNEKRKFKNTKRDLVQELYDGKIIVIPNKYLNMPKLSGIYTKGIWISINKLKENKYNTRFPKEYLKIIGK